MIFSKACEYGIRATVLIAQHSLNGERVGLKVIAKEIASPEAFTAKILQTLSRNKIVSSIKGPRGGFEIPSVNMENLRLYQIVKAIDGEELMEECGLGLKACNPEKPCPIHHQFKDIRTNLVKMLRETTVHDLAIGMKDGATFLKV